MIFCKTPLCLGCLQFVGGNCILRQETTIYINGLQGEKSNKSVEKEIVKSIDPAREKKVKNLKANGNGEVDIIPEKLFRAL